jgi:hypothetical protein
MPKGEAMNDAPTPLEPCPLCGNTDLTLGWVEGWRSIGCSKCRLRIESDRDEEAPKVKWNRRAPKPTPAREYCDEIDPPISGHKPTPAVEGICPTCGLVTSYPGMSKPTPAEPMERFTKALREVEVDIETALRADMQGHAVNYLNRALRIVRRALTPEPGEETPK